MMNEQERLQILEMIEKGVISASEGVKLLNSLQGELEETSAPLSEAPEPVAAKQAEVSYSEVVMEEAVPGRSESSSSANRFDAGINKWRNFWWIPLVAGIIITVVSGLLMFVAYLANGFGFWFACLWFPLLFGVLVMALAAASRTARWLHVRIHQAPGERPQSIAISLPIPIRFVAWVMRIIKPRISGMDNLNLDEALRALDKVTPEEPFYVKVNEGDSGDKVEVYIG